MKAVQKNRAATMLEVVLLSSTSEAHSYSTDADVCSSHQRVFSYSKAEGDGVGGARASSVYSMTMTQVIEV